MINNIYQIFKYNFIGFTNSAVRVSILNKIKFPEELIALDWYLFSLILINKKKGFYLNNVFSYYRVHNKNYSKDTISIKEIRKIINIKNIHYTSILKKLNNLENSTIYKNYCSVLYDLNKLNNDLFNKSYKTEFIKNLKNNILIEKKGWWSEV